MIDKMIFPKAYVEVLEILKYIPEDEYEKIPIELIHKMQIEADKEYKFEVTNFENFQEQKLLKETETILAVLYRDYWASKEKRQIIFEKEKKDFNILEIEKRKKFNPDDLFVRKEKNENNHQKNTDETAMVEYKEKFFMKLLKDIKKFLHKKN